MARNRMLPAGIAVRGLTHEQAAAFAGLSIATFDKARREGKYPRATLPGRRYDLALLQAAMDRLSGVSTRAISPLDAWRMSHGQSNNEF